MKIKICFIKKIYLIILHIYFAELMHIHGKNNLNCKHSTKDNSGSQVT